MEEITGSAAAPLPPLAPVAAAAAAPAMQTAAAPVPPPPPANAPGNQTIDAPLAGTIVGVLCKPGDRVTKGQVLFVIEALKMENEILSAVEGTVATVLVSKGQAVGSGLVLATLNA